MTTTVLFSTFSPFPTLSLSLPSSTTISSLATHLHDRYPSLPRDLLVSTHCGVLPGGSLPLSVLQDGTSSLVSLRLTARVLGGKGGFGSQLRAAGGRMSSQKTSNSDSCRDLSGRRLSTIKEAKKIAEYLESEPARKKAAAEATKTKLEAIEKKLEKNGKKHRLDDSEYLEQSREIVENVKNAVSVGFKKQKRK